MNVCVLWSELSYNIIELEKNNLDIKETYESDFFEEEIKEAREQIIGT